MAYLSEERRRQMEDELNRFENEIAASQNLIRQPQMMAAGALRFIPHTISRPILVAPQQNMFLMQTNPMGMGGMQPPNMSHLLPSMGLGLPAVRRPIKLLPLQSAGANPPGNSLEEQPNPPQQDYSNVPPPPEVVPEVTSSAVIEGAPTVYIRQKQTVAATATGNRSAYSVPSEKKEKPDDSAAIIPPLQPPAYGSSGGSSAVPPGSATGQVAAYSIAGSSASNLPAKPRKFVRAAGGQVWEDTSLSEWDPSDFRLFCGDLGNEVSDELLAKAFRKYPTFQKAKVIRDKRTNKTKGYGFVSFKDPQDFIRAQREMNGKYVGNRPIKLRKSDWQDRQLDVVRKKNKEKKKLGFRVK